MEHVFDLEALAAAFPDAAQTMLVDVRLADDDAASCRLFRVYTTVPAHYHSTCDEFLMVVKGRASFFIGDGAPFEATAGQLIHFKKQTVHGIAILEAPLVFLAIDTPRRDPRDITFVNPADGTPDTFIRAL
jgi:mannose-6-phosphate isomerase-like protein (cupin superfamily)